MKADELIARVESQSQRLASLESDIKKLQQSVADISAKMASFTSGLAELKGLKINPSVPKHDHSELVSLNRRLARIENDIQTLSKNDNNLKVMIDQLM